jgi:hypothetical protein
MSGDTTTTAKPWDVTKSTPAQQTNGVVKPIKYAALAKYEVNVRSFHPNVQFEGWGFRFHGDNRGFSLGKSFFGNDTPKDSVTARIWQRYVFDTDIAVGGDLVNDSTAALRQESNTSGPGPGAWSALGHEEPYTDKKHKPRGKLAANIVSVPHGGQKEVGMRAWYGGENHAFILSSFINDHTGWTFVPTLDVFSELFIRVERVSLYMDIISLVNGDGFPNGEGFIQDAQGNKLFLGTHVRIGLPATHLAGENHRLMWANAIRVEIDEAGNFGDRLWVFAHVLGGPPAHREDYPTDGDAELCRSGSDTKAVDMDILGILPKAATDVFIWDCGNPDQIAKQGSSTAKPLLVSAYTPIDQIRSKLQQTWQSGPAEKTTRTAWNNYHLHRNPNEGRSDNYYDLSKDKWQQK